VKLKRRRLGHNTNNHSKRSDNTRNTTHGWLRRIGKTRTEPVTIDRTVRLRLGRVTKIIKAFSPMRTRSHSHASPFLRRQGQGFEGHPAARITAVVDSDTRNRPSHPLPPSLALPSPLPSFFASTLPPAPSSLLRLLPRIPDAFSHAWLLLGPTDALRGSSILT